MTSTIQCNLIFPSFYAPNHKVEITETNTYTHVYTDTYKYVHAYTITTSCKYSWNDAHIICFTMLVNMKLLVFFIE